MERHKHICCALDMLSEALGELCISSVYESEAVGFSGAPFFNLAVGADSGMPLGKLIQLIKNVEDCNGRNRSGPKFSSRTLDIDVLTYGGYTGIHEGIMLPREETIEYAHVLLPLAEIAGVLELPGTGKSCATWWREYDKTRQQLQVVDFIWRGRRISKAQSELPLID